MKTTINRDPSSRALQAVCDRCGKHGLVYRWTAANREVLRGWYEFRICPPCFDALRNFFNGRRKEAQRAESQARNVERRKVAALDQAGPNPGGKS